MIQEHTSASGKPFGQDWERLAKSKAHAEYGGLPVLADSEEVHERALDLLSQHASPHARILDVGAGAGSFCLRLVDHGFSRVEALELRQQEFKVQGVPVHALDLNDNWARQVPEMFDALVSLEVIEHLENPWHFARQCAGALRPGGILVLSTPNIESSRSRIEFLLRAEFRFFGQRDFDRIGHITSLTTEQIKRVFGQAGMEFVTHGYSRHKGIWRPGNFKRALRTFFYAMSYAFMRGTKWGEASVFVFRRL